MNITTASSCGDITTIYLQTQTQNFNLLSIGDQYSCMCVLSVHGVGFVSTSILFVVHLLSMLFELHVPLIRPVFVFALT